MELQVEGKQFKMGKDNKKKTEYGVMEYEGMEYKVM